MQKMPCLFPWPCGLLPAQAAPALPALYQLPMRLFAPPVQGAAGMEQALKKDVLPTPPASPVKLAGQAAGGAGQDAVAEPQCTLTAQPSSASQGCCKHGHALCCRCLPLNSEPL